VSAASEVSNHESARLDSADVFTCSVRSTAYRSVSSVSNRRLNRLVIVLPTVEGREIWLRRIAKLDEEQQRILHQLQLQLPERLEPIQIQKCSADSAVA